MMMVRRLHQNDCAAVAQLHLQALPTPFSSKSGEALLALYYKSVTAEQGAAGYVAVDPAEQISGFVCGVWEPRRLRQYMLKRYAMMLIMWGGVQLLQRPQFLTSVPARLRRTPDDSVACESGSEPGYELRPIVVMETARGTGVAEKLVEILLQDAQRRGFAKIHLFAEPDNTAACKFYAKVGFTEVRREQCNGQRVIRYRCNV